MLTKQHLQIVILQRGWVAIGYLSQQGSFCVLENPKIIRYWGTTKGLGQLAIEGPTDKTKLDDSLTMRFHELTVVSTIDVDESKWGDVYGS